MIFGSTKDNTEQKTTNDDNSPTNLVHQNKMKKTAQKLCLECGTQIVLPKHQLQNIILSFCTGCEEKIAIKRLFMPAYKRRFNR